MQLQQAIDQPHLGLGVLLRQLGPLTLGVDRGADNVQLAFNRLLLPLQGFGRSLNSDQSSGFLVGDVLLGCIDLPNLLLSQLRCAKQLQLNIKLLLLDSECIQLSRTSLLNGLEELPFLSNKVVGCLESLINLPHLQVIGPDKISRYTLDLRCGLKFETFDLKHLLVDLDLLGLKPDLFLLKTCLNTNSFAILSQDLASHLQLPCLIALSHSCKLRFASHRLFWGVDSAGDIHPALGDSLAKSSTSLLKRKRRFQGLALVFNQAELDALNVLLHLQLGAHAAKHGFLSFQRTLLRQ